MWKLHLRRVMNLNCTEITKKEKKNVTQFKMEKEIMTLKRIGEDSIYLESGDLTGVIESQFIYLNPLETHR